MTREWTDIMTKEQLIKLDNAFTFIEFNCPSDIGIEEAIDCDRCDGCYKCWRNAVKKSLREARDD